MWFVQFYRSTIGKKIIMAVTGLIGIGFVIGHMAGNLQAFVGRDKLNAYGALLHGPLGELLWVVRSRADRRRRAARTDGVSTHDAGARGARPIGYQKREPQVSTLGVANDAVGRRAAPRLHRPAHPAFHDRPGRSRARLGGVGDRWSRDVYGNLVASFRIWWVSAFYLFAMILLGLHLYHGAWSSVRTLGYAKPSPHPLHRRIALVVAVIVWLGLHHRSARRARWRHSLACTTWSFERGSRSGRSSESGTKHRFDMKLVNPANKRKYTVIVVGTGLAGGAAAASLSELGYHVKCFCFQDSPRRAHSIAAQGGINAAKNYQNDGDSIYRLFYDTIKGGDFRSREANVYRLAELSVRIIDQCVAQGVPFAREYGGLLANRSFGGAQVSRTFYARGQTGQQLLLGCYQALEKEIAKGGVTMYPRTEMLDLIVVNGRARGIVTREHGDGRRSSHISPTRSFSAPVATATSSILSTNAKGSNATAIWRAYRRGAAFANPCFTQIHPTCIPVAGEYQSKLTLMSESLRNDGRVWVPKKRGDDRSRLTRSPKANEITISSGSIRASGICRHATSRRARPRKSATKDEASDRAAAASISISPTRSSGSAPIASLSDTGISSRCTNASRTRIRTRFRCASTRQSTTRWADSGSTTI